MKIYIQKLILLLCFIIAISLVITACSEFENTQPNDEEILDGPVEGLTTAQNQKFLEGDIAFNDEVFTSKTGLGPLFVATSCGSCHAGDGKGTPFTTLTRYGQSDENGNKFLEVGGPQLQNRAILGYTPETIPAGATFSKFTPPANTGLGFLELVSDQDIIALSDPNDENGDGISGVPNWIGLPDFIKPHNNAIEQNGKFIHRFGKKAAAYNLLEQTVNAYNQDMGITSTFKPIDTHTGHAIDPEVSDKTVRNLVFYLQALKAPIPRNQNDANIKNGKMIFNQINCSGCHTPELKTTYSPISALSYKTFYPYTDLLLHDMGSELDDKYTEGSAKTYEWRTPALWGLGLSPKSQGNQYFLMHDGRAKSIEEAILLHNGEALNSKNKYLELNQNDKSSLLRFLESL